jgi:hypothetical protein
MTTHNSNLCDHRPIGDSYSRKNYELIPQRAPPSSTSYNCSGADVTLPFYCKEMINVSVTVTCAEVKEQIGHSIRDNPRNSSNEHSFQIIINQKRICGRMVYGPTQYI